MIVKTGFGADGPLHSTTRVPHMIFPSVGLSTGGGGVVTLTEARLRVPLPRTSLSKVT